MIENYTRDAKQRCLSLIDADVEDIWNDIETVPEDTDADKWKKKLRTIADEYVFSSRFALMRIFSLPPAHSCWTVTTPNVDLLLYYQTALFAVSRISRQNTPGR